MKKFLSIMAIAAMVVACGGEAKSGDEAESSDKQSITATKDGKVEGYAGKFISYMERMLDAVEANDYEAFAEAHYSLYLLQNETSEEEMRAAQPTLDKAREAIEERYNMHARRFESWTQRSARELEDEGLLYYGE